MLQSRQGAGAGADLTGAFPDLATAATELGEALVLDGELVVPHEGRLHFGELQRRARRRGRSAVQAAAERPAHDQGLGRSRPPGGIGRVDRMPPPFYARSCTETASVLSSCGIASGRRAMNVEG